jgi:integrase
VRHSILEKNPVADLEKLPENNVRMRILSEEDLNRLLAACPGYLKPLILMAFYTGMRRSEIVFLTWGEVDLSTGFIRLQADRTKTKVSRSIPLHPRVKSMLRNLPRGLRTDRVFLKDGKPFEDFKKSFRSACRTVGVEDFTFHDLRHCAINRLRLAGNDYFKIMAVSGHKTMAVFKRYNLVTEEELNEICWDKNEADARRVDTYVDTNK